MNVLAKFLREEAESSISPILLTDAAKEIERLEAAIRWALGEGDSDFGDNKPAPDAKGRVPSFWWRTELRKRAGL